MLSPFEQVFLNKLRDLPLQRVQNLAELGGGAIEPARVTVTGALRRLAPQTKAMAYSAHLGFYNSSLRVCYCCVRSALECAYAQICEQTSVRTSWSSAAAPLRQRRWSIPPTRCGLAVVCVR